MTFTILSSLIVLQDLGLIFESDSSSLNAPFQASNGIVPNTAAIGTWRVGAFCAFYGCVLLVHASTQAILGSRVYALYGNKKSHLSGLTLLCCILPAICATVEIGFVNAGDISPFLLLGTYILLGFFTDLLLFVFILTHAVRGRSPFRAQGIGRRYCSLSLGKIAESGAGMLSLMISDSVKYYSFTLAMYTAAFGTLFFGVDTESCGDPTHCFKFSAGVGRTNALGLVTFMSMMTGILAPRLLLSVRKEYYNGTQLGQGISVPGARRTITWQAAIPSEHTDSYELGSTLHRSFGEAGDDRTPEGENLLRDIWTPTRRSCESGVARDSQDGETREVQRNASTGVDLSRGSQDGDIQEM